MGCRFVCWSGYADFDSFGIRGILLLLLFVWCCHCSSGGHNERSLSKFHKRILRLASQDELDDMVVKTADEEVALNYVRDKCMGRKMPMVLVGAEYVSLGAAVVVVVV